MATNPMNPYETHTSSLLGRRLGEVITNVLQDKDKQEDEDKKRQLAALVVSGGIGMYDANAQWNTRQTLQDLEESKVLETAKLDRAFTQKEELVKRKNDINLYGMDYAFRNEAEARFRAVHQSSLDLYDDEYAEIGFKRAKEKWIQKDIANNLMPHFNKQWETFNLDTTGPLSFEEYTNPSNAYFRAQKKQAAAPENNSAVHKAFSFLGNVVGLNDYDEEEERLKLLNKQRQTRLDNIEKFNRYTQNNIVTREEQLTEDAVSLIQLTDKDFDRAYKNSGLDQELFDEARKMWELKGKDEKTWGEFENIILGITSDRNTMLVQSRARDAKNIYNAQLELGNRATLTADGKIDWAATKNLENAISEQTYEAQTALIIAKSMGLDTRIVQIAADVNQLIDQQLKLYDDPDNLPNRDTLFKNIMTSKIEEGLFGKSRRAIIENYVNGFNVMFQTKLSMEDINLMTAIKSYVPTPEETILIRKQLTDDKAPKELIDQVEQMLARTGDSFQNIGEAEPAHSYLLEKYTHFYRRKLAQVEMKEAKFYAEDYIKNFGQEEL